MEESDKRWLDRYDIKQVCGLTGMSRATVYRKMSNSEFPMPQRQDKKLFWNHDQIVPYLKTNDITVKFTGRIGEELGRCCKILVGEVEPVLAVEFLIGKALHNMMLTDPVFPVCLDAIEKVIGLPTLEDSI